ncbi:MAG: glycosyltransferase [Acidobacteriia bacterium]|nr:glycosyltransferase [Terriglobia bacterium]
MSPIVSLVVVSYGSSAEAGAALESFRADARRANAACEVVVVDHAGGEDEGARLRRLAPDRLLVRPNRGYAAGVNAGVAAATAPTVLVGNPDVIFRPGSVAALLQALDQGWDIVGPQFVLGEFLFPPSDLQTPGEQLVRSFASRSRRVWRWHLRRELHRWRRGWEASAPIPMPTLSGALLAFRRATFGRVGPWDEGYFLYFEETDWLRRAAASGLRIAQVPDARVEHLYGHAVGPQELAVHYLASRDRFLSAHFGWRGRMARRLRVGRGALRPVPLPPAFEALPPGTLYWLLSPTTLGLPAWGWLGERAGVGAALGAFAQARRARARYTLLTVVPESGRVLGQFWWEGGDG